jgi:hypothetical protein
MASNTVVPIVITAKDETKKGFSSVSKGLNKLAVAATAVAAAIGVGMVKSLSSIDKLAKTADKLGLTTDALQKLRFAAQQTGVGTQALDTSIQRMVRRLSEAAIGTGEARSALKELGLDAVKLDAMGAEGAFKAIAEAMTNVKSQSDKVRLAVKIFDTEGAGLVNTFEGGKAALDAFGVEVDNLGISINRVDAAKIEMVNGAFEKAKGAVGGLSDRLTIFLSGTLLDLTNSFINLNLAAQSFFGAGAGVEPIQVRFILELKKDVAELIHVWALAGKRWVEFKGLFSTGFDGELAKSTREVEDAFWDLRDITKELEAFDWDRKNKLAGAGGAEVDVNETQTLTKTILPTISLDPVITGAKSFTDQFKDMEAAVSDVDTLSAQFIGNFADGLSTQLTEALMTGKASFGDFARSILAMIAQMIIKMLIFKAISGLVSAFSGGAGAATTTALAPQADIGLSAVPFGPNAAGGRVKGGSPIMVGEQGREVFVPDSNGTIIPNNNVKTAQAQDQAMTENVNITLNLSTGVQSTVRAEIMGMMPIITKQVKNSVAEARQRGGSFSSRMGVA